MKKIKIFNVLIILILSMLLISCKKNDIPLDEDGKYNPPILEGNHTILDEDLDLYLLVQGKPDPDLKYAITIYSDFKKENRTSRHYSYYQADYITKDNVLNQYYHFFDFVTDGTQRSYAQRFLPFNKLSDVLKKITIKFEYSFMIENVVYEKECLFEEEMLDFNSNDEYLTSINGYNVNILNEVDDDGNNSYKLNIEMLEEHDGHLDFTVFVKFSDGKIYPLYGIYHYNFARGNYLSSSATYVDGSLSIIEEYYLFKECLSDGTINYIYYKRG